jgi:hypothetical protein
MSSIGDSEHEAQKRNITNIKGLWRDAFRTLKNSTTSSSGSGDDETRSVSCNYFYSSIIYAYFIHVRSFNNRSNQVIQTRHICKRKKKKKRHTYKIKFP